ncbi:hypothetical protein Tco_1225721 [Tanacetum coccineum]
MRGQEEELQQLEEYMNEINDEFMHLPLMVIEMGEEKIWAQESKKIQKITKFPYTMKSKSLNMFRSFDTKTLLLYLNSSLLNQLCVRYVHTIFPSLPLIRKSTFCFKPDTKSKQNSLQVLLSFEVYTPSMTYPKEVEETIGIPMEVEPLDETQLEDLGLNTCSHDLFPSSRKFPSIDELEPQPLPNLPFLDVNIGDKRGPEPPIKPISPDSFRMKVVDHLTIHTPPSSHVASFYPRDVYCYYHPCLDDPKKQYGFKLGLLGQSGSLGVDLLKLEMIDDDLKLESKKGSYLGDGLDLPNKLGNGRIKETHHLEHVVQQTLFQYMAPSHHNGEYRYYHPLSPTLNVKCKETLPFLRGDPSISHLLCLLFYAF